MTPDAIGTSDPIWPARRCHIPVATVVDAGGPSAVGEELDQHLHLGLDAVGIDGDVADARRLEVGAVREGLRDRPLADGRAGSCSLAMTSTGASMLASSLRWSSVIQVALAEYWPCWPPGPKPR